ncbi:hypothetical protein [Rhizobium leguminosarum]|uniref:hypothetical protein n=1 Tax=Rhizobium leguminosarum TaxID=384 RepID=UPI0013EE4787|nr:hypothetical protein [Rhizobium leguminosarum]
MWTEIKAPPIYPGIAGKHPAALKAEEVGLDAAYFVLLLLGFDWRDVADGLQKPSPK